MTSDLSDYGDTINALRHAYDDPLLSKKIHTHAPSAKKNERFLIKMEIRRLAQPIQRVIDLREMFGEQCAAVSKQNVMHYLDPVGSEVFERELARYKGQYCRGVYEFVVNDAKQRAERETEPELEAPVELRFSQIYQRSEERVYLATKIKIAQCNAQEKGMPENLISATTTDLSPRGAAIKMAFKDFRPTSHVQVYFEALQQEYGLMPPMFLRYKRLRSKKTGSHMYLYVLLEEQGNEQVEERIQPLIAQSLRQNKRRNRVALENTEDAVWVKMHEQHFAGQIRSLPVFVGSNQQRSLVKACIFDKSHNQLLPFFALQGQPSFLNALFAHEAIQRPTKESRSTQTVFVLRLRTREGNSVLAVIPFAEALKHRRYAQWIEQAKEGLRCLQLDWVALDPETHGHLPSSLPDEAGEVFANMNQIPSDALASRLSELSHLCTVHDLTNMLPELGLEEALQRADDSVAVADPRIQPDVRHRMFVSSPPTLEKRNEHRFRESIKVSVRKHRETAQPLKNAKSTNLSTRGMALVFDQPHGFKVGDELVVDLTLPNAQSHLQKQRYVAVAAEGNSLRCSASGDVAHHEARLRLRDTFREHQGSLRRDDLNEPVNGYAQALRRLHSHYHSNLVGYICKEKGRYRVSALITGEGMPAWSLHTLIDDAEARMRLCMQRAFIDVLQARFKADRRQPGDIYAFLVAKKVKGMDEVRLICKFLERPCDTEALAMTYRNLQSIGPVTALHLSLQAFSNVNDADYREELRYLARFAKTKHQQLTGRFDAIEGVFIATNISKWLLERWPQTAEEQTTLI